MMVTMIVGIRACLVCGLPAALHAVAVVAYRLVVHDRVNDLCPVVRMLVMRLRKTLMARICGVPVHLP
jgi:hypothetical protein